MPWRPMMVAPVGKSGPLMNFIRSPVRGLRLVEVVHRRRRSTSPRLCGGMFVAMPTAMPPAPFTSRFGKRARQHDRLLLVPVEVGPEVDRLGLDVAQQLHRDRREPGLGVPHTRPPDRRRPNRSCRGRRPADSAATSPGPCAPTRRRPPHRRGGGTSSRPRRSRPRRLAVGPVGPQAALEHRPEDAPVHGLQTVAHVGQRTRRR